MMFQLGSNHKSSITKTQEPCASVTTTRGLMQAASHGQRMQWPYASMTRQTFVDHRKGLLLHRDFTLLTASGDPRRLSRQDAPDGSTGLILHSPRGLELSTTSLRFPQIPNHGRCTTSPLTNPALPFANAWHEYYATGPHAISSKPAEPWMRGLHRSFPSCTGQVMHDKSALAAHRAASRWAARLAEAPHTPMHWR